MMSCAPKASPSPAPAPLFVNRGKHIDAGATQDRAEQLGLGLATGDLDYDPVVHLDYPNVNAYASAPGSEEGDLERALADPVVLAHKLVHAAFPQQAVPVLVHVHAKCRARGLAVDEHAEGNRRSRSGRQHEMRVARVEPVGDDPPGLFEHDALGPGRPLPDEGPLVQG